MGTISFEKEKPTWPVLGLEAIQHVLSSGLHADNEDTETICPALGEFLHGTAGATE